VAELQGGAQWARQAGEHKLFVPACATCLPLVQSNINAQGFRSLREGEAVEFDVEAASDGRCKAVSVTGPGGAAPQVGRAETPHTSRCSAPQPPS
jgi:hypothetical protein